MMDRKDRKTACDSRTRIESGLEKVITELIHADNTYGLFSKFSNHYKNLTLLLNKILIFELFLRNTKISLSIFLLLLICISLHWKKARL